MPAKPKVILFDIGGVCVVSPMSAIAQYERTNSIPANYINHAISASGTHGAWARLERGEISLDNTFFSAFKADLCSESVWRAHWTKHIQKTKNIPAGQSAEESIYNCPPVPDIDAERLYWEMMSVSRAPDPHIYPALKKLRAHADKTGEFIVAACSNTSIFPADHPFSDPDTTEGRFNKELKSNFELFVSSAHVGMRKPNRDIYEYTVRELDQLAKQKWGPDKGVSAQDIVFLDDIGANLKAARAVGMRTIKVIMGKTDAAVKELEKVTSITLRGERSRL